MNTSHKVGLVLSAVATALWAVVIVAFLMTRPDDGVTVGAAMLALLAVPLSVAPVVVAMVLLTTGVATFVASSALFASPPSRQD